MLGGWRAGDGGEKRRARRAHCCRTFTTAYTCCAGAHIMALSASARTFAFIIHYPAHMPFSPACASLHCIPLALHLLSFMVA